MSAIRDATYAELKEHGYSGVTFEGVARRAKTSKPVLYRRWADRRALLRDVVALTGPSGFIVADNVSAVEVRDRRLDRLADLVEAGLDVDAVLGIARGGPPHVPTLFTRLQW